ncbi:MAG: hypothetical protein JRF33_19960 [Deltaproteobacteria bacterium]|nr:hypothetical protein [Deltaproteobacteria bacterium]
MRTFIGFLLAAAVLFGLLACTIDGDYKLSLIFPSDEARQATERVEVWALDPGGGTCEELIEGSVSPGEMTEYARLVIRTSNPEDAGDLREIPEGNVLFFAEGQTADAAVILRGCLREQVKGSNDLQVTVNLELICGPVPEKEITDNGVDDDCDGTTDEEECTENTDCEDGNVCTADFCIGDLCQRTNMDGIDCNDDNPCTTGDICNAGVCLGEDRDCSDFDGPCVLGACNPSTVECESVPRENGTSCEDGMYCSMDDACLNGACSGRARICGDDDPCTRDWCDEALGDCAHALEAIPDAEGPQGDPTCDDLLDNDCDGLTDTQDPNCRNCTHAEDCEDNNPCTTDLCGAGDCSNLPVVDGTACEDNLFCTVDERCTEGVCLSSSRDCSVLDDACHTGICVEAEDQCSALPKPDDTSCEDGLYCTVGDRCLSSLCTPTGSRVCDDSDFCTVDSCDEDLDRCDFVLAPRPGEEGPPGDNSCSNGQDDDCDGQTDEEDGNCSDCLHDEDCNDNNDCTTDTCTVNGLCQNEAVTQGSECDDGDPCTMHDECLGDYCSGAPRDSDQDGHVDVACGGDDCDDTTASAHPGLFEGPDGSPSCVDSLDNDCDGKTDLADTLCWRRICSQNGWCWENPLPQGNGLMGIWGFSQDDVWMVGRSGIILHWDGLTLSKIEWQGTPEALYDVWGTAPTDIWTVGAEGFQAHFNGTIWSPTQDLGEKWIYGLWGFDAEDIWVSEASGYVHHYDGQDWTDIYTGNSSRLLGIWGPDPENLWAVGWEGAIRRRSGSAWHGENSTTSENLHSVWGVSIDDVWAVGDMGTTLRRQGGSWARVEAGVIVNLYDVWGVSANDVWAVGEENNILHFDGSDWTKAGPPATRGIFWSADGDLDAVWGSSADDVWATGSGGTVLRYDGSDWTNLTAGHRNTLYGVWSWSEEDAWAVGKGCTILRRDLTTRVWESNPVAGCTEDLLDISGATADNIWTVGGNGLILKWAGTTWTPVTSNTTTQLNGVWTLDANQAWAVGDDGVILRYLNGQWSATPSGVTSDLNAVWAYSADVAMAVGDHGVVLLWDGTDWNPVISGTEVTLTAIWGSAQDDAWITTSAAYNETARMLHWNGSSMLGENGTVTGPLLAIWGKSSQDVWATGLGILSHYDGTNWSPVDPEVDTLITDIWGDPQGSIWIVGGSGSILQYKQL